MNGKKHDNDGERITLDTEGNIEKLVKTFFREKRRDTRHRYFYLFLFIAFSVIFSMVFKQVSSGKISGKDSKPYVEAVSYKEKVFSNSPKQKNGKTARIVIVPISGAIQGSTLSRYKGNSVLWVKDALQNAANQENTEALILFLNSPGGTVKASNEIYTLIKRWKRSQQVKVIAYVDSIVASGAYLVAQATDTIITNPDALVGSIGVIMGPIFDVSKVADRLGIGHTTITTGAYKDIGSPLKEMSKGDKAVLQKLVDNAHESFIQVIVSGRRGKLTEDRVRELADGRIWVGSEAVELGLVDESVPLFDDLLSKEFKRLEKEGKYDRVEVLVYRRKKSRMDTLFSKLSLFIIEKLSYGNIPVLAL